MPEVTYHDTREIFENGQVTNLEVILKTYSLFKIKKRVICF